MAFTALTSGEVASAQPVASTVTTKIKNNFDDHESRIQTLESSVTNNIPIIWRVNGYYDVLTGLIKSTTNMSMSFTGVRILIDKAGSAGTTQIDILRKRGGGAWTSIFTTLPSVAFGAGNDALSTNAVLNPTMQALQAGDILRLDITSAQTDGVSFLVRIDYTKG